MIWNYITYSFQKYNIWKFGLEILGWYIDEIKWIVQEPVMQPLHHQLRWRIDRPILRTRWNSHLGVPCGVLPDRTHLQRLPDQRWETLKAVVNHRLGLLTQILKSWMSHWIIPHGTVKPRQCRLFPTRLNLTRPPSGCQGSLFYSICIASLV